MADKSISLTARCTQEADVVRVMKILTEALTDIALEGLSATIHVTQLDDDEEESEPQHETYETKASMATAPQDLDNKPVNFIEQRSAIETVYTPH